MEINEQIIGSDGANPKLRSYVIKRNGEDMGMYAGVDEVDAMRDMFAVLHSASCHDSMAMALSAVCQYEVVEL